MAPPRKTPPELPPLLKIRKRKPDPAKRYLDRPRLGFPGPANDKAYTPEEVEFAMALDRYKRAKRRPFPTCAEVLAVAVALGYRKVEPPAITSGPTSDSTATAPG